MPVTLLQLVPGLHGVKHSPFALRTPEAVAAIAVLTPALTSAPAAAPAQPGRTDSIASTSARKAMVEDLLLPDMFFEPAAF